MEPFLWIRFVPFNSLKGAKRGPYTTNTGNIKVLLMVFLGWTERNPSLWYIRYTLTNLSCVITAHSSEKSKLNCIQINERMWIESSSVKWLNYISFSIPPFAPFAGVRVKRMNVTGQWETAALTGHTVSCSQPTLTHCLLKKRVRTVKAFIYNLIAGRWTQNPPAGWTALGNNSSLFFFYIKDRVKERWGSTFWRYLFKFLHQTR